MLSRSRRPEADRIVAAERAAVEDPSRVGNRGRIGFERYALLIRRYIGIQGDHRAGSGRNDFRIVGVKERVSARRLSATHEPFASRRFHLMWKSRIARDHTAGT